METAQGVASHCQTTSRVSGGGNNGAVSTTYVALFRLGQRQIQFSSGSPLSVADGDQVIIAGRPWGGALYADAVRNVTTGITKHSGIVARILVAVLLLVVGFLVSTALMRNFGTNSGWLVLAFVAGAGYLLWRASQASSALRYVKSVVP